MKKLFIVAAAIVSFSMSAQANDLITKATMFLEALERGDLKTAETFIGADMVFEDPTFNTKHEGRAEVMEVYKNYTGGTRGIRKLLLNGYESANTVVLNYAFYVEMNVAPRGEEASYVPVMGRGSRLIDIQDGKIVRHMDFADYGAVQKAMETQAAK